MSELFETIEKNAQDQAERDRVAYEERQAERRRTVQAKRRKATVSMLIRLLVVVALCAAMSLARSADLMAVELVRGVYVALAAWLSFYLGAWIQFMWCKGGLLEWQK